MDDLYFLQVAFALLFCISVTGNWLLKPGSSKVSVMRCLPELGKIFLDFLL